MILEIHLEKVGTQKKSLRSIIYSFRRIRDILRKFLKKQERLKMTEILGDVRNSSPLRGLPFASANRRIRGFAIARLNLLSQTSHIPRTSSEVISTASKRFKIKEVNPSINRVRRMLTSEEILRKIEENIDEIKRFGVKRIGLFGSYVRGEQRAESDVDILVEFEKGKATFDNFLDLAEYLEKLLGKKIDLLTKEGVRSIRIGHIRKEIEENVIYVS